MTDCDECKGKIIEVNGLTAQCENGHIRDSRFSDFTEENGWTKE